MSGLGEWNAGDDVDPPPPRDSEPRWRLAKALTITARELDRPYGPQASNHVKNRGERLSTVIWKGRPADYGSDNLWTEEDEHALRAHQRYCKRMGLPFP
jgi:hypothetical protein